MFMFIALFCFYVQGTDTEM